MDPPGHKEFYEAIRSGRVQEIDKWLSDHFASRSEELDGILSNAYNQLKLKNVPLSEETEIFVQEKLINLRFFHEKDGGQSVAGNELDNIKKRMDMVIEGIESLEEEYSDTEEVDSKFLYWCVFIAKNIRILKRQLPGTYEKLPWEEIEFSLVSFVSCFTKDQEINFVLKTILDKKKLLTYLAAFKDELCKLHLQTNLDRILPTTSRKEIAEKIIESKHTFWALYNDYDEIRDIYSLKEIERYINLVLSDNMEEEMKQKVIERAVQVTGEYLKSSLTSPNISETLCGVITQSLSESTRKILIRLRDCLSHANYLPSRIKIAANQNTKFQLDVQNDLKKVGEKINDIFYQKKAEAIRKLLRKIANCKTLEKMKEITKLLGDVSLDEINEEEIEIKERETVKKLVEDLNNHMKHKTDYQKELFNEINVNLRLEERRLRIAKLEYVMQFGSLRVIIDLVRSGNLKMVKCLVQRNFERIPKKDTSKQEKIVELLNRLSKSTMHNILIDKVIYHLRFTFPSVPKMKILKEHFERLRKCDDSHWRRTIEDQQAKFDAIFRQILSKELILQDEQDKVIEEFKCKSWKFVEVRNKLHFLIQRIVDEECQGKCEIQSEFHDRYRYEGIEELIGGLCLEKCDKNLLKMGLTKPKRMFEFKRKENRLIQKLTTIIEKINDQNLKSKVKNIFNYLVAKMGDNVKQVEQYAAEKLQEFQSLLNCLQLEPSDHEKFLESYKKNDWNSVIRMIQKSESAYEEFLWLIDNLKQDSINKISQLFNKFSQPLTMESNQKEKLNERFKMELEQILKSGAVIGQKLSELETILEKNEIRSKLIENFSSYKLNRELQATVEILVFDIVEALKKKQLLTENSEFFDNTSILIGKQLRNYLAHADPLIDVLSFDPLISIVCNAKIFVEQRDIIIEGKKLIGQAIEDDPSRLKKQHEQNLVILDIQSKMFSAAEEGNIPEIKFCIRKGADVRARDIYGWNALHYAARGNQADVAKFLLGENLNFETKNNKGDTPIHIAACFGGKDIVGSFVKDGDPDVNCLLHYAVKNGHKDVVDALLNKGAEVNAQTNIKSLTPLHLAAKNGHKDVVDALLNKGAEVIAQTNIKNLTPLHFAAKNGHKDVVDALLNKGAEVNAQTNIKNLTPLHFAAKNGHKDVVDALLNKGAEVYAKTNIKNLTPLHFAAQNGHKDVIDALLNKSADVNAKQSDQWTPLHYAAKNGHRDVVDALIIEGAEVNAEEKIAWTPLHFAAQNGHNDVVDALLMKGAEVNAEEKMAWTPLHLAAQNGHNDVIDALLNKGADFNVEDKEKWTPLHFAALNGNKDVVDALLKRGADFNAKESDHWTPLHFAAQNGHNDVVDALLYTGADFNAKESDHWTPLHFAAQNGHNDVVHALLNKGARVNAEKSDQWTPLHLAATNGHNDVVDALLNKGADVYAEERDQCTPLHLAAQNGHRYVVDALLKKGADIDAKESDHWTPLHFAAQNGHNDVVGALLNKGADMDAKESDHWTPLHLAAQNGNKDVVDALLKRGAEFNAKESDHWTPLHLAAQNGHNDVVDALLYTGADFNAKESDHWTPLHLAAQNGHNDVVHALLNKGSRVNAEESDQWTPLHLAATNGHNDVVDALLNKGADVYAEERDQWTPLHLGAENGHRYVVDALLNEGAEVDANTHNGYTSLHMAAKNGHKDVVDVLLKKGANVNAKTTDDDLTPLKLATQNGHKDVIHALLLLRHWRVVLWNRYHL